MSRAVVECSLRSAVPADDWAVRELFGALHAYNAALDPRFVLGDGWEQVLCEYVAHVRNADRGLIVVSWMDARPVGLMMVDGHSDSPLFRYRHWAEVLALYVAPDVQGCGVADALLRMALGWAHERGYERMQLYVTTTNIRARRFYARCGFHPVQEVWRYELGGASCVPPEDVVCARVYAEGYDLLSPHPHQFVHEDAQDGGEGDARMEWGRCG